MRTRVEVDCIMSRFKLVVLSMFAALAAAAIASASASAACSGGTQSVICLSSNNTEVPAGAVALGESGLSLLQSKVGGAEVKLHCTHDLFNATLQALGLATGEIDFLGCTVEKPAGQGCTVGEGANKLIPAVFHLQLSSGLMPGTGLATGTKGASEEFTSLTIGGAGCSVANTYTVTGLQTLTFPSGESALVEHEIVATKPNSKLKLGIERATFSSTAKVHLASGASWLLMLGV
jgi:hypothetical protein